MGPRKLRARTYRTPLLRARQSTDEVHDNAFVQCLPLDSPLPTFEAYPVPDHTQVAWLTLHERRDGNPSGEVRSLVIRGDEKRGLVQGTNEVSQVRRSLGLGRIVGRIVIPCRTSEDRNQGPTAAKQTSEKHQKKKKNTHNKPVESQKNPTTKKIRPEVGPSRSVFSQEQVSRGLKPKSPAGLGGNVPNK